MTDLVTTNKKRIHRPRVMPVLLMKEDGLLYKTQKYAKPKYVGDPRIAVKIFNDKCADELVLLDIDATRDSREPNYELIEEIAGEAFMPVAYGGGIKTFEQAKRVFSIGIEKVVVNTAFFESRELIRKIADFFGAQSVVVSIDVKKDWRGRYRVFSQNGQKKHKLSPQEAAIEAEKSGAGEIVLNAIDHDGMFCNYDRTISDEVAKAVSIPVIACGGASSIKDCADVIKNTDISAAAAGSIFVFQGPHRAVLIKFPVDDELNKLFT